MITRGGLGIFSSLTNARYCNASRVFFKPRLNGVVVAAVVIFELNLFQIFESRNGMLFCTLFLLERGAFQF